MDQHSLLSDPKDVGILSICEKGSQREDKKYADHSDFLCVLNKSVALALNPVASMAVVLSQSMTQTDIHTHTYMCCLFFFRKKI